MTTEQKQAGWKNHMTAQEEAAFDVKAEKMLAGHRQAPDGRNVFAFKMRHLGKVYVDRFDDTFKGAPGAPTRLDKDYCPKCDKRKVWCVCN